ncbi:hypothetical protein [Kitasatospora sp. A2-31]|uniref:hypothetical protein n=1 Tax=Kitasatospora sp. A2-31 TaxID=2916414 RepID=UPI001EEA3F5A|nr:hypothetical protein [Kitasatospora sp. A2-31]MCG6497682.1 hypothetical protein [Kitasatospora sp. A2-31]
MNTAIPTDTDLARLVDVLLATAESAGHDRAGWERIAREAFAAERPEEQPDHWWLAVPGETYEAAFEALGLHDRIPVTVRYGQGAQGEDTKYVPEAVHRVFVTPEYAGWRLIYAEEPLGTTRWGLHEVIERLSKACGRAQVFYQDPFADAVIWAAAEDGEVVRGYWRHEDSEWTGTPLPWETVLTEADFADDPDEYEAYAEDPGRAETTAVNTAAAHLSVDPAAIDAGTPVRGHGWLALTRAGAGHDGFDEYPEL